MVRIPNIFPIKYEIILAKTVFTIDLVQVWYPIRGGLNSIPECFANHKILPLRPDVISVRKSPWREFLMAAFQTITNNVATVLRNIPLTYVHCFNGLFFCIFGWYSTVVYNCHGKSISLTAKANSLKAKVTQRSTPI